MIVYVNPHHPAASDDPGIGAGTVQRPFRTIEAAEKQRRRWFEAGQPTPAILLGGFPTFSRPRFQGQPPAWFLRELLAHTKTEGAYRDTN